MKIATYYKTLRELDYWTSHNTTTRIHCDSKERAEKVLNNCPVKQELIVLKSLIA